MNPLFRNAQKPQINADAIRGIKSYMQTIKMANNPNLALTALCQQNPQLKSVLDMCRGKNPKDVFMEQCKSRGLDPNQIISMLQ